MIALKSEELRKMLSQIDVKAPMGPRDFFMLVLLYNTGLRVSELAGLNVHDVAHQGTPRAEMHVSSENAKGRRSRNVPMNTLAQKAIAKLLAFNAARGLSVSPEEALLQTKLHRRISPRTIQWLVETLRNKAGLDVKATPHSFRHGAATLMAQCTNNLRDVQEYLGHKRLNTLQVYTHVNRDAVARAAQRMAHIV